MESEHPVLSEIDQPKQSCAVVNVSSNTVASSIMSDDSEFEDSIDDNGVIDSVFGDVELISPIDSMLPQEIVNNFPQPSSSVSCLQTESPADNIPLIGPPHSYPVSIPLHSTKISDLMEPHCITCNRPCSRAHSCPDCNMSIHSICGHAVDGNEGFGSPVYCNPCWLNKRETKLQSDRKYSKRGQARQIERMVKQSVKKVRTFDVGDNIVLPIPEVDKRSPFDPSNLPGVILNRSEEGVYRIGTSAGRLDRCYIGTEFDITHSHFLLPTDVPDIEVSLRSAVFRASLGNRRQFCTCTSGCSTNRCRCRRNNSLCNSRCHKKLACHNK